MRVGSVVEGGVLRDHWAGRRQQARPVPELTWYLTYPDVGPLSDLARDAAEALAPCEHLVPVDRRWLHSTLVHPGGVDQVREADALGQLATAPKEPFVLQELLVFDEGAALINVSAVWQEWLNDARDVLSVVNADPRVWLHVSLCYATGPQPVSDLTTRLMPLVRDLDGVDVGRPVLVLGELHRRQFSYEWTELASHPL